MRYPVGKSNEDYSISWYSAQNYGDKVSYGYHEGEDLNLRTGGDSDIGQPLIAVADGKIAYYHNATHPNSGFGRHMVLECNTEKGKRWYHYAHCLEITAKVKEFKEGDIIGKLGKSGTTLAHLHFSVFKVDPATLYKGIDSIATNLTNLHAWWERFELLSTQDSMTEEEITKIRLERDRNWNLYQGEIAKNSTLTSTIYVKDETIKNEKKKHQDLIEFIINKISPLMNFIDGSEESARTAILDLISSQDKLAKEINSTKEIAEKNEQRLVAENESLKGKLETLQNQFDRLKEEHQRELDLMQKRIDSVQKQVDENNEEKKDNSTILSFIYKIIDRLKG